MEANKTHGEELIPAKSSKKLLVVFVKISVISLVRKVKCNENVICGGLAFMRCQVLTCFFSRFVSIRVSFFCSIRFGKCLPCLLEGVFTVGSVWLLCLLAIRELLTCCRCRFPAAFALPVRRKTKNILPYI